MKDYPQLKLENQLCFPLYAVSKEIVRRYKPFLDPLGLTYTQYIAMMVMWEKGSCSVNELGEKLWLDSGTLTPLLKKLEAKEYVRRERDPKDERRVCVTLTDKGSKLQEEAASIPEAMGSCICMEDKDAGALYDILYRMMEGFKANE